MKIYYQEGNFKIPVNIEDSTNNFLKKVEDLLSEIRKNILENSSVILYSSSDGSLSMVIGFEDKAAVEQIIEQKISNFFRMFPLYRWYRNADGLDTLGRKETK